MITFFRLLFLAIVENCDTCFTYSNISFLVFLTFWIYTHAITNFHILIFFRSSSTVSGLGLIEKLHLIKKGLRSLRQTLVCYYKKAKQKSGLHPLYQFLGFSWKKKFEEEAAVAIRSKVILTKKIIIKTNAR